jgi:transcriptional regulator with XRE-family HTH domain
MTSKKNAPEVGSAVNAVALQNLRAIRRRINDKYWIDAAKRRVSRDESRKKNGRRNREAKIINEDSSPYELVLHFALIAVVNEAAENGTLPQRWNYEIGEPLPEHPRTRKAFAEATGIDDGHLRALEEDGVDFTLDDAIHIARVGNMDLATFLTPPLEALETEIYFPLRLRNRYFRKLHMYEWLMWLRGYRHLPDQDYEEFARLTYAPSLSMDRLDDTRTFRGHDYVKHDADRLAKSPVYIGPLLSDTNNTNPFKAPLSPFERLPKRAQSVTELNKVMIQNTMLLATQMKNVLSAKVTGSLKVKRAKFVTTLDFIRYAITTLVRLLLKSGN